MKKVNASFDGIEDPTCYLFSFAKSLSAVLKNSPYQEYYEDIIATSGFAFRMWAAEDLCPSATSIWTFHDQKTWVENGGLICDYVERLWDQESVEVERREQAILLIKKSIDNGIAVVSWDISGCEWGIINGYDDSEKVLSTIKLNNECVSLSYEKLGKIELPILSVLSVIGKKEKSRDEINKGMMKIAASHLKGEEWSSKNKKGLEVYSFLIDFVEKKITKKHSWNLEYYIGTYASLKLYALKYFRKYDMKNFEEKYKVIFDEWMNAFKALKNGDVSEIETKTKIVEHLKIAEENETAALQMMNKF